MKKQMAAMATIILFIAASLVLSRCKDDDTNEKPEFGGYESQVKWGEQLVLVGGCGDCHTPKKMTDMGPVDDSTLLLSGHPAQQPLPDFDRSIAESKGLIVSLKPLPSGSAPGVFLMLLILLPIQQALGYGRKSNLSGQ